MVNLIEETPLEIEKKDNLLPKCILCNQVPELGLNEGFAILGKFICQKCEEKILTLSYNDPTYNIMIKKLKKIFYKKHSLNM